MSQQELLARILRIIDAAGVGYMLTGSIVSSMQGEPRLSHDIDIVVEIGPSGAAILAGMLERDGFYVDRNAAMRAADCRDMFNAIDLAGGDKVDFWILKDSPFDRERFRRRIFTDAVGLRMAVSSPEDTILGKLDWGVRCGGSEKQFTDALRVYEVQFGNLDEPYMDTWALRLGIMKELAKLRGLAEKI